MQRRRYRRQPVQKKSEGSEQFLKPTVQTKLNMGKPGDKYEVEADKMADTVVNSKASEGSVQKKDTSTGSATEEEVQQKPLAEGITPFVQKMEASEEETAQTKLQRMEEEEAVQSKEEEEVQTKGEEEEVQAKEEEEVQSKEEEEVQAKCADCEKEGVQKKDEEEEVQAKANGSQSESASIENRLRHGSGGQKMDDQTQSEMESGFGADFSNVNIHTDGEAAQMSQDIGAQAFTHGNDIYFNKGKYDPNSKQGKHLLAHELTHTIQQKGMIQKKIQRSNFCVPYANATQAANAEWWLRNTYMRMEGVETFGTEVYNLYDSYLNRVPGDSLAPRVFQTDSSYIHNSFKSAWAIKSDMDSVIDLIYERFHLSPVNRYRPFVTYYMSLSNFLTASEMDNRPINFSNPFSVAGHIAGNIGSSDAGPDYRKITRANVAITKKVLFGNTGYYVIELIPHYEVFDTIDFCPGDIGSPLESLVTVPMSRLEASGAAYDMPFKVIFSPEKRYKRFWF